MDFALLYTCYQRFVLSTATLLLIYFYKEYLIYVKDSNNITSNCTNAKTCIIFKPHYKHNQKTLCYK